MDQATLQTILLAVLILIMAYVVTVLRSLMEILARIGKDVENFNHNKILVEIARDVENINSTVGSQYFEKREKEILSKSAAATESGGGDQPPGRPKYINVVVLNPDTQ